MRSRRLFSRALLLAALTLAASRAGAEDAPKRVLLTYVGEVVAAGSFQAVIDELLGKLKVEEQSDRRDTLELRDVVTPRKEGPAVAHAWVDLRDPSRAKLYVVDPARERVLVREVPIEPGHEELAREALGQILEAAVETLLSGGEIGRPREEVRTTLGVAPPPLPPPPLTPKPLAARGPAFAMGAFWRAEGFSKEALIAQGPGALLELSLAGDAVRPLGWFTVEARLPVSATGSDAGVELVAAGTRLFLGLAARATPRVRFSFLLGAGADFIHVAPRAVDARATLDPGRWTVVPFLEPLVGARLKLSAAFAVDLDLAADVELAKSSYYVARGDARAVVLEPFPVRPSLRLGFVLEPGGTL